MGNKFDDLHNLLNENVAKVGELLRREEAVEVEERKKTKLVWVFAILGIVVVAAAAIYGLYRFFAPDYLEDFEDDFDDDFDDDFFEDEEDKEEAPAKVTDDEDAITDDMTEDED